MMPFAFQVFHVLRDTGTRFGTISFSLRNPVESGGSIFADSCIALLIYTAAKSTVHT
jgi:hypothetical protein